VPRAIVSNPFKINVSFDKEELKYITSVARKRQAPKDANLHLVTDKRIVKRDNVETHIIGLLGEFAFAKLLYGIVDTKNYLGGDTSKDFEVYGVTIEIKTLQGYLTFKRLSDFVADVAVLVVYNKNDYSKVQVQGWITRQDFNNCHFTDNFGYGDRPCVQPAQLLPISTLKAYCLNTRNLRYIMSKIKDTYL